MEEGGDVEIGDRVWLVPGLQQAGFVGGIKAAMGRREPEATCPR